MRVTNGTASGEVEYTRHEDGTWSFRLILDGEPMPVDSDWNFATQELAEEQVNYALDSAALRKAEG